MFPSSPLAWEEDKAIPREAQTTYPEHHVITQLIIGQTTEKIELKINVMVYYPS